MFDTFLFDLDGTITDPFEGITSAIIYALDKMGIAPGDRAALAAFIGPPLFESFEKYYGLTPADAERAVGYYREYYAERGVYQNALYDGIEEVLSTLKAMGKKIALATSKPEKFAVRILEYYRLAGYFDVAAGATFDKSRIQKADVVAYALEQCGGAENAVLVGDRKHDVEGAKLNGIKSIGVLYGYGGREELEQAGADMIAPLPADILRFA